LAGWERHPGRPTRRRPRALSFLQLWRCDADLVSAPAEQTRVPSFTGRPRGSSGARLGRFVTAHGVVETPAFMPVATHGSVKGVTPAQLHELGATIVLSNAVPPRAAARRRKSCASSAGCTRSWGGRGRS
jgi:hypothetical protein